MLVKLDKALAEAKLLPLSDIENKQNKSINIEENLAAADSQLLHKLNTRLMNIEENLTLSSTGNVIKRVAELEKALDNVTKTTLSESSKVTHKVNIDENKEDIDIRLKRLESSNIDSQLLQKLNTRVTEIEEKFTLNSTDDVIKRVAELEKTLDNVTKTTLSESSKVTHKINIDKNNEDINIRLKSLETSVNTLTSSAVNHQPKNYSIEELESNYNSNIEKLQAMLFSTQNRDFANLDKKRHAQFKKLNTQMEKISKNSAKLDQPKKLETIVDCIANRSISAKEFELIKTTVNELVENCIPKEKQREVNEVLKNLAENSISAKRFQQLEVTVGSLALTCVSNDHVTSLINDLLKPIINELNQLCEKIKSTEAKTAEMQIFIDEITKTNDHKLKQMFQKQQNITQLMITEHKKFITDLNKHAATLNEQLQQNGAQVIKELITILSQKPTNKGKKLNNQVFIY
jgi:hypothetical protein